MWIQTQTVSKIMKLRRTGVRNTASIDRRTKCSDLIFETAFRKAVKQRVNALITISGVIHLKLPKTDRRHCD